MERQMRGLNILAELAARPDMTQFPGCDAVIILDERHYTLYADGRICFRHYQLKRVLRDFDRDKKSEVPVLFHAEQQAVTVHSAKTVMCDGTIMESPEYAINQITPAYLSAAPHYTTFQHKIISLVGVERGGYTELDYEVTDTKPWQAGLHGVLQLAEHAPIMRRIVTFDTPEDVVLSFGLQYIDGAAAGNAVVVDNGRRKSMFEFKDLPLWNTEDSHPLIMAGCPRLVYGVARTWEEVGAQLAHKVSDATKSDDDIQALVKKLLEGIECPVQSALKLHKHVQEGITAIAFHPRHVHYSARPAGDVLRSRYGTDFEKAVLLHAMLQAAGRESVVALACPDPLFTDRVLHLGIYDSAWVRTMGMFMRVDKSLHEARNEHLEGHTLLLGVTEGQPRLKVGPARKTAGNRLDIKLNLTMKEDRSLEGSADVIFSGLYNPYFNLHGKDSDKVIGWVKGFVGSVWDNAEIDTHHFAHLATTHSVLAAALKVKPVEANDDGFYFLAFPGAMATGGFDIGVDVTERRSVYALPGKGLQTVKIELALAKDLEPVFSPAPQEYKTKDITLKQDFSIKGDEGAAKTVEYSQKLDIHANYVPPERFDAVRSLAVADKRGHNRTLVLRKK
ncbi:DUF3857 and transglutaminase domain-containing protein [bacterium]|nr:DUF3857 and transglutaminase domain-containing protein [candidate division CSSED10-310 bacterium]